MKRKGSRILAGVLIAALLLPLALKVGAEEIYGLLSGSSFSSYITFYNMKNEEAALYVSKSVESADAEHPAPEDDVFEFVLKLNGEIARDLHYTLMDEKGNHIYNYEDGQTTTEDKNKFEVELKTDRYGRFFLKAGQTAKFENLRPNDYYEVTESECDPYVQIDPPAGEAAKGTLTPEGADRVFRNLYLDEFSVRTAEIEYAFKRFKDLVDKEHLIENRSLHTGKIDFSVGYHGLAHTHAITSFILLRPQAAHRSLLAALGDNCFECSYRTFDLIVLRFSCSNALDPQTGCGHLHHGVIVLACKPYDLIGNAHNDRQQSQLAQHSQNNALPRKIEDGIHEDAYNQHEENKACSAAWMKA